MNPASLGGTKPGTNARTEQVLLFAVANQIFAVSTHAVQEIRSTDSLAGTANDVDYPQIPWVRHTIRRGQRTYYVVNAASHFGLPITRPALLLIMRGSRTAVLIDRIERMAEISRVYPLPRVFAGDEQKWYRGLAYADDRVIPVIEPAAFLSADDICRLDGSAQSTLSQRELEGTVRA
jgi:chemotaxis signal transduction protein